MNKELQIINQQEVLGKEFKIYGTFEEPLFLAKDVAEWIEHSNPSKMLNTVDEEEKVKQILPITNSYTQVSHGGIRENTEAWFLTEDGLYEVLMQSRKPIAKAFKKEVKKILKQVRKHGMYAKDELLDNPDLLLDVVTKLKAERDARVEAEKQRDRLIHINKTYTSAEIAKELGLKSAIQLNKILQEKHVQYKTNGTWLLYSDYADKNFVDIKEDILENDKIVYYRRWTGIGRDFILSLFK